MSLERDLVFQLKEQGIYSDGDILKTCEDYVNDSRIRLPINEEQAKKEIERYDLLQKYLQQTGNRRMLKRMFNKRVREIIYKETQDILNNPETLSIERVIIIPKIYDRGLVLGGFGWGGLHLCGNCLEPLGVKQVYVKGTKIIKLKNNGVKRVNFKYDALSFCTRCQSIFDRTGIGLYEER